MVAAAHDFDKLIKNREPILVTYRGVEHKLPASLTVELFAQSVQMDKLSPVERHQRYVEFTTYVSKALFGEDVVDSWIAGSDGHPKMQFADFAELDTLLNKLYMTGEEIGEDEGDTPKEEGKEEKETPTGSTTKS